MVGPLGEGGGTRGTRRGVKGGGVSKEGEVVVGVEGD